MLLLTIGEEAYPDFTVKVESEKQLLKQMFFLKSEFPEKEIKIWRQEKISFHADIGALSYQQEL